MESFASILHFWFGDSPDDAAVIRGKSALWWKKNPIVDAEILRRFEPTLEAEARGELVSWSDTASGHLARILLCDQFARNMYRGTPRSFAYDARARTLARAAIDIQFDKSLRPIERVFIYMPFEHSEDKSDQELCLALITALHNQVSQELKSVFADYINYAVRHKAIIDRFGRFPHRNTILGRESTPEERDFLKTPGSSF